MTPKLTYPKASELPRKLLTVSNGCVPLSFWATARALGKSVSAGKALELCNWQSNGCNFHDLLSAFSHIGFKATLLSDKISNSYCLNGILYLPAKPLAEVVGFISPGTAAIANLKSSVGQIHATPFTGFDKNRMVLPVEKPKYLSPLKFYTSWEAASREIVLASNPDSVYTTKVAALPQMKSRTKLSDSLIDRYLQEKVLIEIQRAVYNCETALGLIEGFTKDFVLIRACPDLWFDGWRVIPRYTISKIVRSRSTRYVETLMHKSGRWKALPNFPFNLRGSRDMKTFLTCCQRAGILLTIESEFPGQEMLYLGIIKAVGEDTLSIKAVDSAGVWQKLAVNLPLNAITQIHIEDKYTSLYDFGTKL